MFGFLVPPEPRDVSLSGRVRAALLELCSDSLAPCLRFQEVEGEARLDNWGIGFDLHGNGVGMAQNMLQKWRKMNGRLPNNIIYYRDGVSDGQFVNVLQRELNLLDTAFKNVEATYEPRLVIIVGQTLAFRSLLVLCLSTLSMLLAKRHQTRLWMADDKGKGGGKDKGKGKKDPAQADDLDCSIEQKLPRHNWKHVAAKVRPGTVASDNIAQPSHMNFFLVSQEGIQGTSVPCHYHILHLDKRLVQRGIKVDDFEIITFQLCHLYSRADKSVGYATPAYMADHVCERGKHYLEAYFGHSDVMSTLGTSSSEERKESEMREEIEKRISWLNERAAASGGTG
ncbi:AGO14 [Symbiodinium natans]|uniref:AGO14 protein n=1 Tax=Symbiodinium natans TaxID=878477 RepID=A0A812MEU8_9DINO|nr:AGO14 [Symbiodinium natans]